MTTIHISHESLGTSRAEAYSGLIDRVNSRVDPMGPWYLQDHLAAQHRGGAPASRSGGHELGSGREGVGGEGI